MSTTTIENETSKLLTVKQVAERLSLCRTTIYDLMERGDLPYHKIGRARRIAAQDVLRLLDETRYGGQ